MGLITLTQDQIDQMYKEYTQSQEYQRDSIIQNRRRNEGIGSIWDQNTTTGTQIDLSKLAKEIERVRVIQQSRPPQHKTPPPVVAPTNAWDYLPWDKETRPYP